MLSDYLRFSRLYHSGYWFKGVLHQQHSFKAYWLAYFWSLSSNCTDDIYTVSKNLKVYIASVHGTGQRLYFEKRAFLCFIASHFLGVENSSPQICIVQWLPFCSEIAYKQ